MAVDLHIHTTASSDGDLAPREIVKMALDKKLEAIAITDHDTVNGLEEALCWGSKSKLEVIPGCEIYATYQEKWLHILGYFIDYKYPGIIKLFRKIEEERIKTIDEQIRVLREGGFYLEKEAVLADSERPMFNSYGAAIFADRRNDGNPILEKYRDSFDCVVDFSVDYIIPGKAYNAPPYTPPAELVINTILQCGGVPILAHPAFNLAYKEDWIIDDLLKMGIEGIEVYTSWHNDEQAEHYNRFCQERKLLYTCGSDFHGKLKPNARMGEINNNSYEVVRRLKAKKAELHGQERYKFVAGIDE